MAELILPPFETSGKEKPPSWTPLQPSLTEASERDSFRRRHACRCTFTLSLSSEFLHGHPALVAPSRVWPDFCTYPKASPCAPVPLWIFQVHPSGTPALALRASVQRLLLSSIHLANTTGPMSDSSSPVWTFSLSRYSLPVFLLLQLLLFPLETLSVPPLASKLHCFDSCISMNHALPRSPSWISRLPCGTGLSFANNRVVSHPNNSLACYMCREHLCLCTSGKQFLNQKSSLTLHLPMPARRTSLSSTAIIAVVAASED
ncbi:hypothetical protein Acr_15g0005030 [Actinidia rufa]|uniref:Uncharacterized protein n=1 Tax=Actinidia rufa TaxID=165716 RepID=A0A7J0FTK0_9ERIC|nr:hypothetical protein Acr_15g0005030 [Actinidia rufa]